MTPEIIKLVQRRWLSRLGLLNLGGFGLRSLSRTSQSVPLQLVPCLTPSSLKLMPQNMYGEEQTKRQNIKRRLGTGSKAS